MRSCILKNLARTRRILRESFAKTNRTLTYSQLKQTRRFSSNLKKYGDAREDDDDDHNLTATINAKYKIFQDQDADVILDVSEERQKIKLEELNAQKEFHDPYADLNLKRE